MTRFYRKKNFTSLVNIHAPKLVVDQKGLSAEFLQKVSAKIRQKVFLHLFVLSVLLQKHYISAERPSFCRNLSFCRVEVLWRVIWYFILRWNRPKLPFLQPTTLKMMHYSKELLALLGLQKDPFSAKKMTFSQKDPLSVLSVFLQKGTLLGGCLSAFCRKAKFLFRSTTNPSLTLCSWV